MVVNRKEIKIHIIDDEEYERDEEFYVLLGKPQEVDVTIGSADGPDPTAILGDCCKTTVLIREDHEFKSDVGMSRYLADIANQQQPLYCIHIEPTLKG